MAEPTSRLTITIPTRLKEKLKRIAEKEGRTMVWYINDALEKLNEEEKEEK